MVVSEGEREGEEEWWWWWLGEIDFDNVETNKNSRGDSRILI